MVTMRSELGIDSATAPRNVDFPDPVPPEIRIWDFQIAPPAMVKTLQDKQTNSTFEKEVLWNVLYDSTKKLYSYRLCLAPVMDPLERHYRWHPDGQLGRPIDPSTLKRLLHFYEGEHDFRAFAGSVEQIEKRLGEPVNTVRTVYSATLVDEGQRNFRVDVLLKGALYKQVRSMVGTVLDVCRGSLTEEEFCNMIKQEGRDGEAITRAQNRCKPAPPEGLTLEHVFFDDDQGGF